MMTKAIVVALSILLILLLYELWFGRGGLLSINQLRQRMAHQQLVTQHWQRHNRALTADIEALKKGDQAIEERARSDLGMIKQGEQFYQIVTPPERSSLDFKETKTTKHL